MASGDRSAPPIPRGNTSGAAAGTDILRSLPRLRTPAAGVDAAYTRFVGCTGAHTILLTRLVPGMVRIGLRREHFHKVEIGVPHTSASTKTLGSGLAGRSVLVVGLGRFGGGVAVTRWLAKQNAVVTVTDLAESDTLAESLQLIAGLDVRLRLGGHDHSDLDGAELAVVNPAVDKSKSALFLEVQRRRIPWTTETNLFCERCPAPVIAVTGTYGKSTTCAMLAHTLQFVGGGPRAGYERVFVGGNIGNSLLPDLAEMRATDLVVLELSNAQLEDIPRIDWTPKLAVITNLSPHHLDRHGTYNDYLAAKANVLGTARHAEALIAGDLDEHAKTTLTLAAQEREVPVIQVRELNPPADLRVPGGHNQANSACVCTVFGVLGLNESRARAGLATFKGLPHRLEHVRTVDGVDYYNDSKSTSPITAVRAVESFGRPIVAIVGGQEKHAPIGEMVYALVSRCSAVVCTGESASRFAEGLRAAIAAQSTTDVPEARLRLTALHESETLETAVDLARKAARPGDLVLFSPAAPSFDRYVNFVERGNRFVTIVNAL